jgi:hypothetical protein
MGKTFRYTKITGQYYCAYNDDYEQDGVEFDYEVEDEQLLPVLVDLMFGDYFGEDRVVLDDENLTKLVKENLKRMIDEQELVETLADNYEETLKEIFQDEAMDFYND